MLNIIPRNEKAAPIPSIGSFAGSSSFLIFFMEMTQTGTIAAPMTAQVCGLR